MDPSNFGGHSYQGGNMEDIFRNFGDIFGGGGGGGGGFDPFEHFLVEEAEASNAPAANAEATSVCV